MRTELRSPTGREDLYGWAKAFVVTVFKYRDDLLSSDGQSGAFHGMVTTLREQRQASQLRSKTAQVEKDGEKARSEAFTQKVYKRMPKFARLIRFP